MTLQSTPESFGKLNVLAMVRKLLDSNAPILTITEAPTNGVNGSFATYPVGPGAILINVQGAIPYINTGELGNPEWTEIQTGSAAAGLSQAKMLNLFYDSSIHETAVGTHTFVDQFGDDIIMPRESLLTLAVIDVTQLFSSGGAATFGVSVNIGGAQDIQTQGLIGASPWDVTGQYISSDLTSLDDPGTPISPNWLTTFSNATINYTIGVDSITGGRFRMWVWYYGVPE